MGRTHVAGSLALVGVLCLAPLARPADETPDARPDTRYWAKVELGRRLFFDPAASRFGATSCASCHDPEHGFGDPERISRDEGRLTVRHSQGLLDIADNPRAGFHWDGEFATVADLVTARLGVPDEVRVTSLDRFAAMARQAAESGAEIDADAVRTALPAVMTGRGYGPTTPGPATPGPITRRPTPAFPLTGGSRVPAGAASTGPTEARPDRTVTRRLEQGGTYAQGFKRAFGGAKPTTERIAEAIEAYVLSLRSTEAPFDRYMAGDESALTASAARGFELFAGKAGCNTCHSMPVPGSGRALTDAEFHNTGVAFRETRHAKKSDATDKGLGRIDFRVDSFAKFKTPNLRDVARRAPYMHDGSFATLADVVDYYADGGTPNDHLDGAVQPFDLSKRERADLVAFLESLSGDGRAGLGDLPDDRPDETVVFLRDEDGKAVGNKTVTVQPAGDWLRGVDALPAAFTVRTDKAGRLRFPFPASTHVALRMTGREIGAGRLLPDTTRAIELYAISDDMVAIEVFGKPGEKRLPGQLHLTTAVTGRPIPFQRKHRNGDLSALYVASSDVILGRASTQHGSIALRNHAVGDARLDTSRQLMATIDLRDTDRLMRGGRDRATVERMRDAFTAMAPLMKQEESPRRPRQGDK